MNRYDSFTSLIEIHQSLTNLLMTHQEALVLMQADARARYDFFCKMLRLHIGHEDNLLLPIFNRAEEARWPHKLYDGEHRKLELHMDRCAKALDALGAPEPDKARQIIDVIDTEGVLKRLLEHHDEREQQDFFPVLDRVTTSEERSDLLQKIYAEWDNSYEK